MNGISEITFSIIAKAFSVNDELLRQAKWVTKKLYLINMTGQRLRANKEHNIQNVLAQNGRLIEECNILRNENEKLTNRVYKIYLNN